MFGMVKIILIIGLLNFNFLRAYVLLSDYVKGYEKKCYVQPVILNPPLPPLNITYLNPGDVLGVKYDKDKDYCRKLECSLWSNDSGEGYKLRSDGCALVRRPKDCVKYAKEDLSLPYPECCYHSKCPKKL